MLSAFKSILRVILACLLTSLAEQSASTQISFPDDLGNLALHIDATDITGTGVQPASGAAITQWNDLSGNSYHLTTTNPIAPSYEPMGFDGLRPSVRFAPDDRLTGPDILPTVAGEMTIFFVTSNVNSTRNFSVNLNGSNNGSNSSNGRYSFHTPWGTGDVFFDAGGCCGSTRLRANFPNAITETSIYTASNDLPGNRQILRIDGSLLDSDTTGHAADSTGGIVMGSTSGRSFDGRFGELIVYSRALADSEIDAIEQYLYCKWKPALSSETCAQVDANKSVDIANAPVGNYSLPGGTARYTIAATNAGPFSADSGSMVITDEIPANTTLKVIDIGGVGDGPVLFSDGSPPSSMTYSFISLSSLTDDVEFSNDGGVSFSYIPIPDGLGADSNVTHIRIRPKGDFLAGTLASPAQFSVSFDVLIN